MNTFEINEALRRHPLSKPYFVGCYPADKIPSSSTYPHSIVVNTDASVYRGAHWVAIWVSSPQRAEYYDSLADWPPPPLISQYLLRFKEVDRTSVRLQALTAGTCGRHALYFVLKRSAGQTFEQIIDSLLHPCQRRFSPDSIVYGYTREQFKSL